MESLSRTCCTSNFTYSLASTFFSTSIPLNPSKTIISLRFFPKAQISIRCSHKPSHPATKSPILNPLQFLAISAVAASAILLARCRFPSFAIAANIAAVHTASAESVDTDRAQSDDEKMHKLEEQLDSNPSDCHCLRELLDLKVKARKYHDAIAIVDRLIELESGDKGLFLLKAHIQNYSGDAESARQGFEAILAEEPLFVEAYHGLVLTQREEEGELDEILKRVESALETCKKLKKKEDARDFKMLIAQIKVVDDKHEDALKIYQELVKEDPRDFRPYLCQGIIYTLQRKKEEAEKQFEKYRRLIPRGHPYSRFFEDSMSAMKISSQIEENKKNSSLNI